MTDPDDDATPALSEHEHRLVESVDGLKAPLIYEAIRRQGAHELGRPFSALWWSGVAAGLAISASVLGKAFLTAYLPDDAEWTPLVSNLGYSAGFLIVIMGRLQLFTENTVTPILSLLLNKSLRTLARLVRLWTVVFLANMTGCLIAAATIVEVGVLPPAQTEAVLEISRHYAEATPMQHFLWGAPAGFLVAALVWTLPSAQGAGEFWLILVVTYFIGLGGLSHVVAGATELFVLALLGESTWLEAVRDGVLPALAGNVVGGTGLFALMAYGQVREELLGRGGR
jgi:formate-nitrite transporter family protein